MKQAAFMFSFLLCIILAVGCATTGDGGTGSGDAFRRPEKYNFRFAGFDEGINNPESDRRSYYKVFIDKAEEGRTTTGLESQVKTYEATLQPNRHLITVEKWVLDRKTSSYVKLNNIDQPKPNFFYFDLPEDRIVTVEMKALQDGKAEYTVDFERN